MACLLEGFSNSVHRTRRIEMDSSESRQITRESMFLMADLRVDGQVELHRVKVRNLSNGGMMADGKVRVSSGTPVSVHLRNIGWVDGAVAWVQDSRFGIAFREEVDAKLARIQSGGEVNELPRYVRPVLLDDRARGNPPLRKI
jgi:hypothetical protein